MFGPALQLSTCPSPSAPPRPRPVSFEAILVLGAFVLAGLIWLAVGAAVMRRGPKPAIRSAHQIRAAAGEDLETLL